MGDFNLTFSPRHVNNPAPRQWLNNTGDVVTLPGGDGRMQEYLAKGFKLLGDDGEPVDIPPEVMPAQTMRFRATAAEIEFSAMAARVSAAKKLMEKKGTLPAGVGRVETVEPGSGGVYLAMPLTDPHGLAGVAIEPPGLVSYGLHSVADEDVIAMAADPGFAKLLEDMEAGKNPVLAKAVEAQAKLDSDTQAVNAARVSGKTVTADNVDEVIAEGKKQAEARKAAKEAANDEPKAEPKSAPTAQERRGERG